jgi:hypothetical protein
MVSSRLRAAADFGGAGNGGLVLGQHLQGAVSALAAAGRYAQVAAQLIHGGQAKIGRLADFAVRDIVADTNNHGAPIQAMTSRQSCRLIHQNENHYH